MSKKTNLAECSSFDFEIKTKREDANNGFLDLKMKEAISTKGLLNWEKNIASYDAGNPADVEINQVFIVELVGQTTLNKEGFNLGRIKFRVDSILLKTGDTFINCDFLGIEDKTPVIKRYNKDCITVAPEQLKEFHTEQIITAKVWKTDEIWEDNDDQSTLDEATA